MTYLILKEVYKFTSDNEGEYHAISSRDGVWFNKSVQKMIHKTLGYILNLRYE